MQLLREVGVNTRHEPNGWHYGAVSMACLKAGDEDGALSVQSEWRDKQVCSINRVYLPIRRRCVDVCPISTKAERLRARPTTVKLLGSAVQSRYRDEA